MRPLYQDEHALNTEMCFQYKYIATPQFQKPAILRTFSFGVKIRTSRHSVRTYLVLQLRSYNKSSPQTIKYI